MKGNKLLVLASGLGMLFHASCSFFAKSSIDPAQLKALKSGTDDESCQALQRILQSQEKVAEAIPIISARLEGDKSNPRTFCGKEYPRVENGGFDEFSDQFAQACQPELKWLQANLGGNRTVLLRKFAELIAFGDLHKLCQWVPGDLAKKIKLSSELLQDHESTKVLLALLEDPLPVRRLGAWRLIAEYPFPRQPLKARLSKDFLNALKEEDVQLACPVFSAAVTFEHTQDEAFRFGLTTLANYRSAELAIPTDGSVLSRRAFRMHLLRSRCWVEILFPKLSNNRGV